jgi:hypothetical protein
VLSPQEQQRLAELESKYGRSPGESSRKPSDTELLSNTVIMSPDEENRLAELEAKYGNRETTGKQTDESLIGQIGSAVDQYTGAASLRKGVDTLINTGDIRQSVGDAVDQYSQSPDKAPTSKEILTKVGFSDQPRGYVTNPKTGITRYDDSTDAGTLGFIADATIMDPLNIITALPFAKLIKGGEEVAKLASTGAKAADNVVTGGKFVRTGEAVIDTSKAAAEATKEAGRRMVKLFRPDVANDYEELAKIAEKNGIDPAKLNEAHQFGENSVISRHARAKAEGPLGGDDLAKHAELTREISSAADKNIAKISGIDVNAGVPGRQEAGAIIREGYDEGVDAFFKQMDHTYNSIIQQVPGIRLTPESATIINKKMASLEKQAKGLVKRGITATDRSQGAEILKAVEAYRSAGPSLKQQKEAMNMIGRAAFKTARSGAELPSDVRTLREMYFSLQKGFTESVRSQLGDDIAEALIKNNKEMSRHFTERGSIARKLERAKADEEVFVNIIEKGNSQELGALKEIMTLSGDESKWKALKGTYLDSLMNRNADGVINFKTTRKKLNGLKEKLKNIYTPDELQEVDDVLKLGDRGGIGVLSTSGTGGSNSFRNIKQTMEDFVVGDAMTNRMKSGAMKRANYVETPAGFVKNTSPAATKKSTKSGFSLLGESSPITKKQAAQGAKLESIQERNKRIEEYKRLRNLIK